MVEATQPIISITTPHRSFEGHRKWIREVAVFHDGCRMVTSSDDQTIRLWDMKGGVELKKMEGHSNRIQGVAISRDGQLIASGDDDGKLIFWHGDTGKSLTQPIQAHSRLINSLDFSPDGAVLTTGSWDKTAKLWSTKTWQMDGNPISCGSDVNCVRYSASGELAIATDSFIEIWNPRTRESIAKLYVTNTLSLAWTLYGTHLLSGDYYCYIREWNTLTWEPIGDPWAGHTSSVNGLAVNSTGTLVASASYDNHVRLWRLSDQQTIAIFKHSRIVRCVDFSPDDKHVFSGGNDNEISEWAVPEDALIWDIPEDIILQKSRTIFASRCTAKLRKMLWDDALLDAQKVIEINPSSYLGYELKDAALYGAQRYDEAIEAFEIMLSKLNDTADIQTDMMRQQYISLSEARVVIQKVIDTEMENVPPRLFNTSIGRLCDREAQINAFKTSMEYKKLLSMTMKHADLRMEHIQDIVAKFFQFVMLSHRWEGKELLLHDMLDRSVYELDPIGGTAKLQSFCRVVRDAGYFWAWSDTCCINKNNIIELQQSVNTMFVWYRHSALTVVYLSDVLPSSKSGALAMSVWNSRGWTVQEFLAPNIILFYQSDWTLYLNDHSPNHKRSAMIMRELEDATGINGQSLIAFQPGMRGAREKLRWASMRVTTLQEDIAYSLFGIFGVHLAPIYGENKQNALGRLLQEIVAKSGDITCLDWVGRPSEFNSCLPASITSYGTPPSTLSSPLSEDEMQTSVSLLRDTVDSKLASRLYERLESLSIPQFTASRLRLPCIVFVVTEVKHRSGEDQQSGSTFGVKAAGLRDLLIATEDKQIHLFRARPTWKAFLLVLPWDRSLLDDSEDLSDTESMEDLSPPIPPLHGSPVASLGAHEPVGSASYSGSLQLISRLGQPFSAILLAPQRRGEYKRIASDQNIIAQVKDMTAVHDLMDIRTLEIL